MRCLSLWVQVFSQHAGHKTDRSRTLVTLTRRVDSKKSRTTHDLRSTAVNDLVIRASLSVILHRLRNTALFPAGCKLCSGFSTNAPRPATILGLTFHVRLIEGSPLGPLRKIQGKSISCSLGYSAKSKLKIFCDRFTQEQHQEMSGAVSVKSYDRFYQTQGNEVGGSIYV